MTDRAPSLSGRSRQGVVLIGLLMALAVVTVASLLGAGRATGAEEDPAPLPNYMTPELRAMIEDAASRQEQLAEERETPAAEQAREETATAFESQTAAEALATATEELPETVSEPAGRAFDVLPASDVEQYYDQDTSARVDVPGEPADAIVQSTLPLKGESDSGGEAPVNLSLEAEGAGLEPKTPLVETAIPDELNDEVTLGDSEIGFAPQGASGASDVQREGDTAFYANADTDTDFMVRPAPTGAEAMWQLRSTDSPESVVLDFTLPVGAALDEGGELGGARIVQGGDELGQVTRPQAFDAEGWPVELSFDVDGDRMVIEVPHRDQDVAYPIVVDPGVNEGSASFPNAASTVGWQATQFPAEGEPGSGQIQTFYYAGYLVVRGNPGPYQAWEHGAWRYDSPGTETAIFHADYYNAAHTPASSVAGMGMLQPDQVHWDQGTTNSPWFPDSPIWTASGFNHSTPIAHCIGSPSAYCIGGTADNEAWLEGVTPFATNHTNTFQVQASGITVAIADFTPPTLGAPSHTASGSPGLPTGWVDDEELSVVAAAKDRGFGVKRFELSVPGTSPRTREFACTGAPSARCPNDDSHHRSDEESVSGDDFTYLTGDMPEGVNTVTARAMDALGNWSQPQSWQVKVEHTAPTIEISGSLADAAAENEHVDELNGELLIQADDGGPYRSGVTSVEVEVDGEREEIWEQECVDGACSMSRNWVLPVSELTPGQHDIAVHATDAAGTFASTHLTVEGGSAPAGCTEPNPDDTEPSEIGADNGVLTPSEAVDVVEETAPEIVEPSIEGDTEEDTEPLDPSLCQDGDAFAATGTAVDTLIPGEYQEGQETGFEEFEVSFEPVGSSNDATDAAVVHGDSVIYANTAPDVDTIVRPTALGIESFEQIRSPDAPQEFSWRVGLKCNQHLELLPDGSVALVEPYPVPAPEGEEEPEQDPCTDDPDVEATAEPAERAILDHPGDADAQFAEAQDATTESWSETEDLVVALVEPPASRDAAGQPVPSALSIDGDIVTMTVEHEAGEHVYPVIADPKKHGAARLNNRAQALHAFKTRHRKHGGLTMRQTYFRVFPPSRYSGQADPPDPSDPELLRQAVSKFGDPAQAAAAKEDEIAAASSFPFPDISIPGYSNLNDGEKDYCKDSAGNALRCVKYYGDSKKAVDFADSLFVGCGGENNDDDDTRCNAFQHAFWVALMVESDSGHRRDALRFSRQHEANGPNKENPERRRSSRMDILNNHGGYRVASVEAANNHDDKWFCSQIRFKSNRASFISTHENPWHWYNDHGHGQLVFRKYRDSQGNYVQLNGHNCSGA